MKIKLHKNFKKSFHKRIKYNVNLKLKFDERLAIFRSNRNHFALRDHALKGDMEGYRAFSITGDVRVIYTVADGVIILVDIGTHSQVY